MTIQQTLAGAIAFFAVLACAYVIGRIEQDRDDSGPEPPFQRGPQSRMDRIGISLLSSTVRIRLDQAGLRGVSDKVMFAFARLGMAIVLAAIGFWFALNEWVGLPAPVLVIVGLGAGWWFPGIWLDLKVQARRAEIEMNLPLMLDLVQICIEGGMSLDAAWDAVERQLSLVCEPLAEEMRVMQLEMNVGVRREDALRSMGERSGLESFSSLAAMMVQSERFGSGLADTLGAHADGVRYEQMQMMEERAHLASLKILIPLCVFLLPAVLVIIAGPMLAIVIRGLDSLNMVPQ